MPGLNRQQYILAQGSVAQCAGCTTARLVQCLYIMLFQFVSVPRSGFGPLASLSSSLFGAAQQDPATGIAFPASYCVLKQKHCPELAGVGVRAKRILGLKNINVYSVGLYVDAPAAKKALHSFRHKPAEELVSNQAMYDALVSSGGVEKTLRLVISFGALKRGQFVSALEERIKPPLKQAAEPASTMEAFERLFDGAAFRKGMEVTFTTNNSTSLTTQIDGKTVGTIQSPALVKALFDIYLGRDAVSADAKKSFGSGLAALLAEK